MMIPRKMEFDDAAYACTRISGELASYITRTEFEELVDHLAIYKNILAGECLKDIATEEDIDIIQVYLGGSDVEIEGNYTTLLTKIPIQVRRSNAIEWKLSQCNGSLADKLLTCPGGCRCHSLTHRTFNLDQ